MARKPTRSHFLRCFLVVALCYGGLGTTAAAGRPPVSSRAYEARQVCAPPKRGHVSCLAYVLLPRGRGPSNRARAHSSALGPAAEPAAQALTPADLHAAYNLPSEAPNPPTVAVVDAYNDPRLEADLAVFDQAFNLPPCAAANGCLRVVSAAGPGAPLPGPSGEWSFEIALDVETVHAICENCRILLVEAAGTGQYQLAEAQQRAYSEGAKVISDSFGGPEPEGELAAYNHTGVAVFAAAGDNGYRNWDVPHPAAESYVDYPAASPHVIAVGATRLILGPHAERLAETVWNDGAGASGGGCALNFEAPRWQQELPNWSAVGCGNRRAVVDLSAVGDPYTGEAIYDSMPWDGYTLGWVSAGGTSMSTPLLAAADALAGGPHNPAAYAPAALYETALSDPSAFNPVTVGANGRCAPQGGDTPCPPSEAAQSCNGAPICLAGPGYNGPAGLGSPDGLAPFQGASDNAARAGAPPHVSGKAAGQPSARLLKQVRIVGRHRHGRSLTLLFSFELTGQATVEVRLVGIPQVVRTSSAGFPRHSRVVFSRRLSGRPGLNRAVLALGALRAGRYRLVVRVGRRARAATFRLR